MLFFLSHFFDETSAICFPYCTKFGYLRLAIYLTQMHDNPFIPKPSVFHISGCSLHKAISISLRYFFIASMIFLDILILKFLGYQNFQYHARNEGSNNKFSRWTPSFKSRFFVYDFMWFFSTGRVAVVKTRNHVIPTLFKSLSFFQAINCYSDKYTIQ